MGLFYIAYRSPGVSEYMGVKLKREQMIKNYIVVTFSKYPASYINCVNCSDSVYVYQNVRYISSSCVCTE